MSIQPTFTCVACEYRRLPFDPQESAGTCPSCEQQYVAQPERVSKSALRILLTVETEDINGGVSAFVEGPTDFDVWADTKEEALKKVRTEIVRSLDDPVYAKKREDALNQWRDEGLKRLEKREEDDKMRRSSPFGSTAQLLNGST